MIPFFNQNLIEKIKSAQQPHVIQPVQIGSTDQQNELVFFLKPELLSVDKDENILNSFQLIAEKFSEFNVVVNGAAILPGNVLSEYEIMNRHYGFINQLSRFASKMVNQETRDELFKKLGIKETDEYKILGGHEFLQSYSTNVSTLNEIWFEQGAQKLRSGFYFMADTYKGDPILLINGFHPSQLLHFTREDHRILLLLIHTNTDWYDLKFDLVGDTFPENANPDSIRGKLFTEPNMFGQKEVGINTNGVHLSAGPFEAAFEIVNFFGQIISLDPEKTPPLAVKRAIDMGIDQQFALSFLDNPPLGESDLFSETENLNTLDAIHFAQEKVISQ